MESKETKILAQVYEHNANSWDTLMLQTMQVFGTFILQDPRKLEVNSCGTAASLVGMTTAPQKKKKQHGIL